MSNNRGLVALLAIILLSVTSTAAQSPPQRDERAVVVFSHSLAVMGGSAPADSTATGQVAVTEGSKTQSGTIRILTRGLDQSFEEFALSDEKRTITYSQGSAKQSTDDAEESSSVELAASSQSPALPLLLLQAALENPDVAIEYLGLEKLENDEAHHIRFWNTFASNETLRVIAKFTEKHIWISKSTNLVSQVSYDRRAARGASPVIPMSIAYSDYRNVGGFLYPFKSERTYNGSPWATITIQQVAVNSNLSELQFKVQ